MGSSSSKSKNSYKVEPSAAPKSKVATPTTVPAAAAASEPAPAPSAVKAAAPSPAPPVVNTEMVPKWINESQFVEILTEHLPQFAKIQSFSVKPAMSAGENYATLMLRVKIEAELKDKTVKPVSLMMKVPHDVAEMQQMLEMANFFTIENEVYINLIPKFEEFYKSKGLDITLAPRAYKFTEGIKTEPKLANTVLMYDLGQDGYKNVNRLECLNIEQTKVVLRKIAQYHAVSAAYKSVHGPYPDLLTYGMFGTDIKKAMAMFEGMMGPIQKMFLNNLHRYDNCEQYREKLETNFAKMKDLFPESSQADPSEFNVLNHGDCWVNNFLFKFDDKGELLDMLFVDFQNPRYGHPSADILYFIMTSVHIDHKLKHFDYFIKYYHDQLIEHLTLLEYKERMPKLAELQMQMYKYGAWALMASFMVLPVVLLDPNEAATFENFFGDGDAALDFKSQMYTNKRYKLYIEQILPWLDNRGLLEAFEAPKPLPTTTPAPASAPASAPAPATTSTDTTNEVPDWVSSEYFKDVLKAEIPDFKEIKDFHVKKATSAGDNYSSIMLSVDIDYHTVSGKVETTSFMLKVPPGSEISKVLLDLMLTFKKEVAMYNDVIPQLEQLFKEAGQTVVFGPKSYKLPNGADNDRILLQNLRPAGFKNADRLKGLTVAETEHVLAKLAQLHAASAQLYVTKSAYADCLDKPVHNEKTRPIFDGPENKSFQDMMVEAVKSFKGGETYAHKVAKILENLFELEVKAGTYDKTQFNVLNHGDCWTNNVMFTYGPNGEVTDTLFVDFQRSCFNSPAYDLYYLLMSSPSFDIKIEKFDYFIRYYHTELKRNLELLKYPRDIPSLKDLHNILLQNPLWAVTTVSTVMSAVLLDPTENASIATMMGNDEEGKAFRKKLFNNDRYRKHAEALYPFLDHRGLLDFDYTSKDDTSLDWLSFQDFSEIIAVQEPQFDKILGGTSVLATKPGDNYASKLYKMDIQAQLKDKSTKTYSYMLKVALDMEIDENSPFNMFPKEIEMYEKILPAFMQYYQEAGLSITFSPKTYRLNKPFEAHYLLMDNLQASGFEMLNRAECLDMEHTKSVLKKLAQWHAASLRYKELNGPYAATYNNGWINEATREMCNAIFEPSERAFRKVFDGYNGVEEYKHKLDHLMKSYVDSVIDDARIDEQEFNVLNHGDLWTNNVMFQHNESGQVQETYLLDHQLPKYGNPAFDLYYFLMSSAQLDIKTEKFDYLIRWYHENLVEHAKLLKCTSYVPSLKELHIILLKHPVHAAGSVFGTLTLCLADATDEFSMDMFTETSGANDGIYEHMYGNERYKAQFERIMPWLNRRGLLDEA